MEIKIGMVVWKKSGSPKMTVKAKYYLHDNQWSCTWFDGNEIKEWAFNADELTTEDPNTAEEGYQPIGFSTNSTS